MTEPTHRMLPHQEALFAPLRRDDLPSFLVVLPDMLILSATPACAPLGIEAGRPAPLGVKIVAKRVGMSLRSAPRLERVRLPFSFVPRPFACIAVQSPSGHVVVFADPVALASGPNAAKALPGLTRLPTVTAARPVPRHADRSVRFSWDADETGHLRHLSPHVIEALGGSADAWIGRDFDELAEAGLLADGAPMRAALRSGSSFFGLTLMTGGRPPRRIEFGGVPLFDTARRRLGTRGFGLVWGDEGVLRRQPEGASPGPSITDVEEGQGFNVVPLRGAALTARERSAFNEIARTLTEAIEEWPKAPVPLGPPPPSENTPGAEPQNAAALQSLTSQSQMSEVSPTPRDFNAPSASSLTIPVTVSAEHRPNPDAMDEPAPVDTAPQADPAGRPSGPDSSLPNDLGDEHLLDRLPIGIVVQQAGATVRTNKTLLGWLGIKDMAGFITSGGLSPRLVRDARTGGLDLESLDGDRLPVEVRLVSSPWQGRPALVHVIRSLEGAAPFDPLAASSERDNKAPADEVAPASVRAAGILSPMQVRAERAGARRQALDFIPFPVLLLDHNGTIEVANLAASEASGFSVDDLEDEPFTLLLAQDSHVAAVAMLDRASTKTDAGLQEAQLTLRHRLGGRHRVEAVIAATGEASTRFCLVMRQVSAPEATYQPTSVRGAASGPEDLSALAAPHVVRIPHAPGTLDTFVRRISHDLRDPLTALIAFVDTVRQGVFGPVGNIRYVRQAEGAAAAGDIVMAMLSDLDGLAVPPAVTPPSLPLTPVIEAALAHAAETARRRRILLRSALPAPLSASCDEAALSRILRLLLDEALRATPTDGQVILTMGPDPEDGSMAVIQVRDGGPPLNEEEISQALDLTKHAPTSDRFTRAGRPFRMAHLAALARTQGGSLALKRGVDLGMLAQLRLRR